jgi:hypothetical protein
MAFTHLDPDSDAYRALCGPPLRPAVDVYGGAPDADVPDVVEVVRTHYRDASGVERVTYHTDDPRYAAALREAEGL